MSRSHGVMAGVGVAALLLALWFGMESEQSPQNVKRLALAEDCPLHLQACESLLPGGGKVTFEMSPKDPNPTEPLTLEATFVGVDPKRVAVSFEGKDMYMGYLQYPLRRQDDDAAVHFSGRGSLSICVRSLMEWIALLKIEVGDTLYEVPFAFETFHQPSS